MNLDAHGSNLPKTVFDHERLKKMQDYESLMNKKNNVQPQTHKELPQTSTKSKKMFYSKDTRKRRI